MRMCGRGGVDKYRKRDPGILSKHLPKDVSNGKFGKEVSTMNGRWGAVEQTTKNPT